MDVMGSMAGLNNTWAATAWGILYPGIMAFTVAVVGYLLAAVAERLTRKVFKGLYYEEWFEAQGVDRAFLGIHVTDLIATIVKWWVFIGFFAQAIGYLGMPVVTEMALTVYGLYVNVALGIIYLAVGMFIAKYVGIKMRESGTYGGEPVIRAVQAVIIYFALITALPHFGIRDTYILTKAIEIALWAVAIAFGVGMGIAIGLGGQDVVKDVLKKKKKKIEEIIFGPES
ncbi:MAG TPA: hypothetical protein EYH14_01640 [Euryarchaeota archaeon]|nr:hypothetical protein [Euryarchaeota archaeon]